MKWLKGGMRMKSLRILIDAFYVIVFMSAAIKLFWIPILGTSFLGLVTVISMLIFSVVYITERIARLQVTVRTYAAGRRNAVVISIEKKGEWSSDDWERRT